MAFGIYFISVYKLGLAVPVGVLIFLLIDDIFRGH
jgi:hypothetical protein